VGLLLRVWLPVTDQLIPIILQILVVMGIYVLVLQLLGLSLEERQVVNRLRWRVAALISRR
jgi:hypothetical protein